jgi:hypothetical protein
MSSPFGHPSDLPPQPRPRAQAELAAQITAVEANRERWIKTVEGLKAVGLPCYRAAAMLRLAEQRLNTLHLSRAVLAVGDQAQR